MNEKLKEELWFDARENKLYIWLCDGLKLRAVFDESFDSCLLTVQIHPGFYHDFWHYIGEL